MKYSLIVFIILAASCSSPAEEMQPMKDWNLNDGTWSYGKFVFMSDGRELTSITWPQSVGNIQKSNYDFFGDSLKIELRGWSNEHQIDIEYWNIVINWDLGAKQNKGYIELKGGIGKTNVTFFKKE